MNIKKLKFNSFVKVTQTVPNYDIQCSYLGISYLPTDLFTFFSAKRKSYLVIGTFISYSNNFKF